MQEVCVSQIYSLIDKNLFFDLCFYQNCDYVQASCDTFYHHQNNSAELASTLSDEEKISVKKLTEQFFNQHHCFCKVWAYLNSTKNETFLKIVSEAKGFIPYELIINMDSFFQTPENEFWEKNQNFFSKLKQAAVNDNYYENSNIFIKL